MSRAGVFFTLGAGTGGGLAQSADATSGLHFYSSLTFPGTFAATPIQPVFSLQDAVTKGIVNTHLGETAARAIYTISGTVTIGDTYAMTVTEVNPNGVTTVVSLGTATVATAATPTGGATDMAAQINAGTYLHGYTATSSSGAVTIIARPGIGIGLNPAVATNPLAVVVTGTSTGAITQQFGTGSGGATAGIASMCDIWYYEVSEFFRTSAILGNTGAVLWIRFAASASSTYADVTTLQNGSKGACMRLGILNPTAKSVGQVVSDIDLLEAQAQSLFTNYVPAALFFAPNIKAISNVSTLLNLQSATGQANGGDKDVTCVISQDGAAVGAQLYVNSGVSVPNIGAVLGLSAAAAVSQNIGEVGVFNISNGVENNVPAFTTGELFSSLAPSLLNQLDSFRYLFCTTYPQYGGTYVNNDWTSVNQTSNYNRLGRILTINKFERQSYLALLPLLKRRIYLKSDGTMDQTTIEIYTGAVEPVIEQLVNVGDLSPGNLTGTGVTSGVIIINPAQNVQAQGFIAITYNLLAVNIADNINVTLQYTQSL